MVIFTFVRRVSRVRCAMRFAVGTSCNILWQVFPFSLMPQINILMQEFC